MRIYEDKLKQVAATAAESMRNNRVPGLAMALISRNRPAFTCTTGLAVPNLSGILFPLVYSGFRRFLICFTYSLTLLFPLFPGTPAPSVVIYVVKNASRPVFGENSPMPDGKRFSLLLAAL